jgi:hypothetical protein
MLYTEFGGKDKNPLKRKHIKYLKKVNNVFTCLPLDIKGKLVLPYPLFWATKNHLFKGGLFVFSI